MAEYETVNSFPVVDQARLAARNWGRSLIEGFSAAYNATAVCMNNTLAHCLPSFRRTHARDTTMYGWEDDNDARWSDELERLLDSDGHQGEDSSNALSNILSRLPFVRGGTSMPYKPSAANLRRPRAKSRGSTHSNGTGGTGESLRSRADLFDHSGDEFEDAGMLPDEHIFALTSSDIDETHPALSGGKSDVDLQEQDRLVEEREEQQLQINRDRAHRLAVKRGLSDVAERPRSSGQSSLRDAIPLRRGRSSTLQSQQSDVVPLRGRSSTLGSQSSGLPSPRIDRPPSPHPAMKSPLSQTLPRPPSVRSLNKSEPLPPSQDEADFTEFVHATDSNGLPSDSQHTNRDSTTGSPQEPSTHTFAIPNTGPSKAEPPLLRIQTAASHTSSAEASSPPSLPSSLSNSKRSDHTPLRRTPSKVPGDYDPVTGYYRRRSDADVTTDDEGSSHISQKDLD